MAGKEKRQVGRRRAWTVPACKRDPYRELRAAKQLGAQHVGTRDNSYDLLLGKRKIEVKCPDSGVISIATLGRKAVSYRLGCLFCDLSRLQESPSLQDEPYAMEAIDEFQCSFVNGVSMKLAARIKDAAEIAGYALSVDPEDLVKPSRIFHDVDALFLAYADGWELIQKRDFDRRLEYSRYSGGLVKLALR